MPAAHPDHVLDEWARLLAPQVAAGRRVFAYFNNDIDAQAPIDAERLRQRLRTAAGVEVAAEAQPPDSP